MIPIKSLAEIKIMKEGGKRLALVMDQVLLAVNPRARLKDLDLRAENLLKQQEGQPSFKMVKGYHWATCLNINQGVVHGIPSDYQIRQGDLLSLDMGLYFGGLHTDMARTIKVPSSESDKFLVAGKRALKAAIKATKVGNRVGHISQAIEKEIREAGFSPIESLTGHGVGRRLHELPQIPCLVRQPINQTSPLEPGMALAIEVIYSQGKPDLVVSEDGWTVSTADASLAGLFEDTVVVTSSGPLVITSSG